ncbi:MAG: 23S rRNA (adenine(2503)-C(2))-methyltransferase RlmN [Treponemataceae bacterium]|nr:23S rRNA (adenine(2503)-C(2))-methyltransferase RlmN [Treponemataceae bacterium]
MSKIQIAAFSPDEINEVLGEKAGSFRGKQVYKWIASGADSFDQMTNISQAMREKLEESCTLRSSEVSQVLKDPDGTVKLQLKLEDGYCVETVLLTDIEERKTACVSSQVGCAMKCAFCQTGKLGFARNLTASEIVEQFFHLEKICGKLDNIVFMGMGEPLLNLEAVRKAIAVLTDEKGRNLSLRRITISTSGIIKGIYDLADNGPNLRLAVSLTTADEDLRKELMPVTIGNPLSKLSEAIGYYMEKTGNRCTLEAALLHNVNTTKGSALALKKFAKQMPVHVNVIPWNPIEGLPYTTPSQNECKEFMRNLEALGIKATQRTRRGQKIGGACGQLGKTQKID